MIDDQGRKIDQAGPSTPVEILGLTGVPGGRRYVHRRRRRGQGAPGRRASAREAARERARDDQQGFARGPLLADQAGGVKELKLVLKADVQGSVEAIRDALTTSRHRRGRAHGHPRLGRRHHRVRTCCLAAASNAIVIGFSVRPESKAADLGGTRRRRHPALQHHLRGRERHPRRPRGLLEPTLPRTHARTRRGAADLQHSERRDGSPGASSSTARSSAAARRAWYATTSSSHDGRSTRSDASRTTRARGRRGLRVWSQPRGFQDVKEGDVVEAYEIEAVARQLAPSPRSIAGAQAPVGAPGLIGRLRGDVPSARAVSGYSRDRRRLASHPVSSREPLAEGSAASCERSRRASATSSTSRSPRPTTTTSGSERCSGSARSGPTRPFVDGGAARVVRCIDDMQLAELGEERLEFLHY